MIPKRAKLAIVTFRSRATISLVVCMTVAGGSVLAGPGWARADACTLPDNGSGTVDLPPQCSGGYTSPEDYFIIPDDLAEGTTIRAQARYTEFLGVERTPGGNFGPDGEIQEFRAGVIVTITGTGELEGFSHVAFLSAQCEVHTEARDLGADQQAIRAEWVSLHGFTTPFDPYMLFRLTAGSGMGLPESPGQIELDLVMDGVCEGGGREGYPCADDLHCPDSHSDGACVGGPNDGLPCVGIFDCPGGTCINPGECYCGPSGCDPHYYVRSTFELNYQIEYEGMRGTVLEGYSGTSSGTIHIQMRAIPTVFMRPVGGDGREITVIRGNKVIIEAYVRDMVPQELAAYQLTLPASASGGTSGRVSNAGNVPVLDLERPDFVFAQLLDDLNDMLYIAGINSESRPVIVTFFLDNDLDFPIVQEQRYLGEFTYVTSTDAAGDFEIDFHEPGTVTTSQTVLVGPEYGEVGLEFLDVGAIIHVVDPSCEVGCADSVFCDGEEACVDDECVAGAEPCPQPGLPFCSEELHACVECNYALQCDDGDDCTYDACEEGMCTHRDPEEGEFLALTGQFAPGRATTSIALADLDGDGDLDLAATERNDDSVLVMMNDGGGVFLDEASYGVGSRPIAVRAGDLDGDGDIDLAVVNWDESSVSVLLNSGDGRFVEDGRYEVGEPHGRNMDIGDLDNDGDLDLVVTIFEDDTVSVLLNRGDGSFSDYAPYEVGAGPGWVAIGDLNGDGSLDLAVANGMSSDVSILLNRGDGVFFQDAAYEVGTGAGHLVLADLDEDGDLDLAVCGRRGGENISVLLNSGDGSFAMDASYEAGGFSTASTIADLDGDGDLDLAVSIRYRNEVSVLLNRGDGTFADRASHQVGVDPMSLATGDLDGDGSFDLAVADYYVADLNESDVFVLTNLSFICLIDGECYVTGEENPANPCEICDPSLSRAEWSHLPGCFEDDCVLALQVYLGANTSTNVGFGPDDAEVSCQPDSNHDAWFKFTAPCNAEHLVTTNGSMFDPSNDTVLSVYDDCGGSEIACDDNSGNALLSELTFTATAESTYFIRVAGVGDSVGDIVLNISTVGRCIRTRDPDPVGPALR